jgi:hypothetical protein
MTAKKKDEVAVEETVAVEPTVDDKAYEREADAKRDQEWMRRNALELALLLAKNNGGMHQVNSIIKDAQVFLQFIKGEAE